MGSRRQALELALQLLYQHELSGVPLDEMQDAWAHLEAWPWLREELLLPHECAAQIAI